MVGSLWMILRQSFWRKRLSPKTRSAKQQEPIEPNPQPVTCSSLKKRSKTNLLPFRITRRASNSLPCDFTPRGCPPPAASRGLPTTSEPAGGGWAWRPGDACGRHVAVGGCEALETAELQDASQVPDLERPPETSGRALEPRWSRVFGYGCFGKGV